MDRKIGWLNLRELTGAALLLVLFLAGMLSAWYMDRQHTGISRELEDSAWMALTGQWENAKAEALKAKSRWEENWDFRAVFGDHTPMEEIDDLFEELTIYAAAGERTEFARICAALAVRVAAMGSAHQLRWQNIL